MTRPPPAVPVTSCSDRDACARSISACICWAWIRIWEKSGIPGSIWFSVPAGGARLHPSPATVVGAASGANAARTYPGLTPPDGTVATMSHQGRRTRRGRFGVIVAAVAVLFLAACAAPASRPSRPAPASPPTSSASASANPVTVPGPDHPVERIAHPEPVARAEPATSSAEPAPEPESTASTPPKTTTPRTPEPDQPEPQEPAQTAGPGRRSRRPRPAAAGSSSSIPGHNGANGANPGIINALVDAGFGQTKPCNTTGTSTNAGYSEHEFTWGVATRAAVDPAGPGLHRAS